MPIVTTPGQDINQSSATPQIPTGPVVAQTTSNNIPPINDNSNNSVQTADTTISSDTGKTSDPGIIPNRVQSMVAHNRDRKKIDEDINSLDDDFFDDDSDLDDLMPNSSSSKHSSSSNSKKGTSLSRMSEDERKSVINKIFALVLGREPVDRDYSYYRFSTLTEEGLIKSLLGLPEHKTMLENAKQYPAVKQELAELSIKFKQADELFHSMQNEVTTMRQLLEEKNRYIQNLRSNNGVSRQQYASTPSQEPLPGYVQPNQVEQQGQVSQPLRASNIDKSEVNNLNVQKLPSPVDEMKSMFKSIFKKNR